MWQIADDCGASQGKTEIDFSLKSRRAAERLGVRSSHRSTGAMRCPAGKRSSPLHTHNLLQRVDDLHKVALGRHDGVDGLVGGRALVQHA